MILISITKLIAYISVCNILDIDILHPITAAAASREDRQLIVSTFEKGLQVVHLLIYTTGIKIGQALQPVGLTGGIATGKSTVSSLLQQSRRNNKVLRMRMQRRIPMRLSLLLLMLIA